MPASIIGRSCRFDSKFRVFLGWVEFVSAYFKGIKKFFRKIEFSHFLPSFFAEKWANIARIEYIVSRIAHKVFADFRSALRS